MITLVMSVAIDCDRSRVWRALTDTHELVAWDQRVLAPVDTNADYPFAGQKVRWRYRLGSVQVVLHEQPREIAEFERLASSLRVGSLQFEQTYTLTQESNDPARTRLTMKLVTTSSIPVVDDVVDRFDVRKLAAERNDQTLRSVPKWCHQNP